MDDGKVVVDKMILKFVRSGDLENLRLTCEVELSHQNEQILADRLSKIIDSKGRGLIYLAVKKFHFELVWYIIKLKYQ